MALLNSAFSPIILAPGAGKDSRWLTLEVCREFARSKCSRTHEECKYAHPPPHVEIQNGRVMCCFDSLKGKCQRKDPPCKYLHPPQHLKEILLQNGRQNLILKNLQMQTTALQPAASVVQLPGVYPIMSPGTANRPYLMPTALGYTYYSPQSIGNVPTVIPTYESGGMLPISMTTNQLVGSFSGTSVPAVTTNGLTQHLIESTPPVNKQLTENSVCASSPGKFLSQHNQPSLPWEDSASPSNSVIAIESTNLPYCQPFFYKNRVMEVMTAIGRKRSHDASSSSVASADDLILGVNGVPGIVPVLKRPALVDPKSGLPFYGQYAGTTAYSAAPAINALHLQQPRTQFLPFTISGTAPVIPRIN